MQFLIRGLAQLGALVHLKLFAVSFGIPLPDQPDSGVDHDLLVSRVDFLVVRDPKAVVGKEVRSVLQSDLGLAAEVGVALLPAPDRREVGHVSILADFDVWFALREALADFVCQLLLELGRASAGFLSRHGGRLLSTGYKYTLAFPHHQGE